MLTLRETTFTGKKEALTLQLAGCMLTPLSVWRGKQHLCWGWDPCLGVTHSSVFFQSPHPVGLQGSGCCNWANFQDFAHLRIRAIAYFRVVLAGHVLPLSQGEKVKEWFTRKDDKIFSVIWYLTCHPQHCCWHGLEVCLSSTRRTQVVKRKVSLGSKSLSIFRNQVFSTTTKNAWVFISSIPHPLDFTEMSDFSQTLLAPPKHFTELKSSTHFDSCSLYWGNFGKIWFY